MAAYYLCYIQRTYRPTQICNLMFNRSGSFEAIDHRSLKSTQFIHGHSLLAPTQSLSNAHVTLCMSYAMSNKAETYSSKITTSPYTCQQQTRAHYVLVEISSRQRWLLQIIYYEQLMCKIRRVIHNIHTTYTEYP